MKNIGQNNLPIKCRDPYNERVKCLGFKPECTGWCMFLIDGWCGADTKDFQEDVRTSEEDYNNLFK